MDIARKRLMFFTTTFKHSVWRQNMGMRRQVGGGVDDSMTERAILLS